eukprot:CAMPEP_0174257504 /NCGR_PEP_ID=MMETSP0439-20130205/6625_1 /TAXON_ID=0 /ORGANISM="Stereomyxa ramosa, Strain Chinc5" /LENGTH=34 /DNA_ID= /DNA_START= /DNA_END= /DNA_ORIENTATION=
MKSGITAEIAKIVEKNDDWKKVKDKSKKKLKKEW